MGSDHRFAEPGWGLRDHASAPLFDGGVNLIE
jgi:hypothetical protein